MASDIINEIITMIMSASIPSFSLNDIDTPIGVVDLSFSDIQINSMTMNEFNIFFLEDTTEIEVSLSNVYFQISLDFSYKLCTFPYSTDSGNLIITSDGASFVGFAHIIQVSHVPSLTVDSAKFSLGDFSLSLRGSSSILSTIIQIATPLIQYTIETSMNTLFADVVNQVINSLLYAVPCIQLNDTTAIDIRQPCSGDIFTDFASNPASSLYYGTDVERYTPSSSYSSSVVPYIVDDSADQRIFSPEMLISLIDVYRQRGMFTVSLYPDEVPSAFPFDLTVSGLTQFFDITLPASSPFTLDSPVYLSLELPETPSYTMMAGCIALNMDLKAKWYVFSESDHSQDSELVSFDLGLVVATTIANTYSTNGQTIVGFSFEFSAYTVEITDSDVDYTNESIGSLYHTVLLDLSYSDRMNAWALDLGYPFSTSNDTTVGFVDSEIWYGDDYFAILLSLQWFGSSGVNNSNEVYLSKWNISDDESICLP
ncbi:BPI/LBP/Plunc family like protein [Aduncisulcus paluster]|uniref:BPI/LBP/Plunc family like protein n=1 Tax=Aduncisulcus paluster TaxID=2918883 RepID=A0ABQ5KY70_9EUKA|nr:BPI/LBP/Plunc family like protein [Aduncisulcus paluster]